MTVIYFTYVATPDAGFLPGIPLADLTATHCVQMADWQLRSVAAAPMYQPTPAGVAYVAERLPEPEPEPEPPVEPEPPAEPPVDPEPPAEPPSEPEPPVEPKPPSEPEPTPTATTVRRKGGAA
ncbi:hypothetical protein [Herpetosiphon geysericola]|uniref:hypothetical protein n=1 Tax=Herpetosiphon geysericola TaxID=70996 RepID=UPI0006C91197|nr:hypothetical protein [Herpetosiphon geysericola]